MEVSNLKVTNDGSPTSLKVKWQKPPGDVDSYNITLSHQGTIEESKTLAPHVTETQFKDLVPGRLYQVTISCISGELSAQKMAMGRTGKSASKIFFGCLDHSQLYLRIGQNNVDGNFFSYLGSGVFITKDAYRIELKHRVKERVNYIVCH